MKRNTPMRRTAITRRAPMRRSPMHRRRGSTSYSRRERDLDYLRWVKTLGCYALATVADHRCDGVTEADHAGRRGLSQKCDDRESIPLCTGAHRDRDAFVGPFRTWTKDRMRAWLIEGIRLTQELHARLAS